MKKSFKVIKTSIRINGITVPVKVYFERRGDVRFSIAGSGAFLRLPFSTPSKIIDQEWQRFKDWLVETANKKPGLLQRFNVRQYQDGDTLEVGSRIYNLSINKEDRKTHSGKISDSTISLRLNQNDSKKGQDKAIRQLISRCVGNDFLPEITERIHYWNDHYFNKPINSIRFKLNRSNWGSCSSKGNINLSTRLLFAPPDVIDYVIVHELAHRIEFNHSPRFWAVVSNVIPEYKIHERWLRDNGHLCQF